MLYTNAADIEFSKHKRLFVIGCSFTHWLWPTWADVITHEHPHLEYYNFGIPGQGSDYIQTMLSQIERKYQLNNDDIVIIMWSSFHRDGIYSLYNPESSEMADCIINQTPKMDLIKHPFNWYSTGDAIGQKLIENPANHICDARGYLIKNLAIIDSVTKILQHANYSGAQMLSVGIKDQLKFDTTALESPIDDVLDMYNDIHDYMLGKCYYDYAGYELDQIVWDDGEEDYHPKSIQYFEYLKLLGFSLSDSTAEWCYNADAVVQNARFHRDLEENDDWPYTKYPMNREFPL